MPGTPAQGGPSWLWELSALAFAVSSVLPHMLLYSPDPSPLHPWCFLLQEALFTIRGEGSLSPIVLCCFTISDMQVIPLKWQKVKRNLRASWWKRGKEESEKAGLKLNIQKTNILASKSITSWQIEGEKVEAMTDFIFLASKITADSDCSHEFKRHLLLGRKALTNLDSILKSRDITLVTKVCIVKAMVSPVQFSSVAQSCLTLCNSMDCSTPGFPVHHQFLELAQTRVHWLRDAIQPSHPLSSPSPPAFNLSQHQDLFQWVSSLHQVAKVLELQLQHQSFQWIFRVDFL